MFRKANNDKNAAARPSHSVLKSVISGFFGGFCRIAGCCVALFIAFSILSSKIPSLQDWLTYDRTSEVSDTAIYEQLAAISEFAVYEYTYTNHVEYTDMPSLLGHAVFGTDHWFAFDYSGTIKVGCDFQDITLDSLDHQAHTIVLKLPEMVVLSNEIYIDMDSYQDRNNLCNPLEPREVLDYLYAQREPELERARGLGIYDFSVKNAESIITIAMNGLGYDVSFE